MFRLPNGRAARDVRRMRKKSPQLNLPIAVLGFGFGVLGNGVANAQDSTWSATPANGNFSSAINWSSLPGIDSRLFFGNSSVTTLTNDLVGDFSVNGLRFQPSAPAYTLSGGTLSLVANQTDLPRIVVNTDSDVTINSAIKAVASVFYISGSGQGNLTLNGGITAGLGCAMYIEKDGTFTLNGTNTVNSFLVGHYGNMVLSNGSSLTNGTASTTTISYLAPEEGDDFTLNVGGGSGSSLWKTHGTTYVGTLGDATVNITGGGRVESGALYLAEQAVGTGLIQVGGGTGTSNWTSSANNHIGHRGTGTMIITGGGTVVNQVGILGNLAGGKGIVNVGGGTGTSTWTNNQHLVVGQVGTGEMTITGQGTVTNTQGYIAYDPGSTGTVTVGGGTGAALWQNTGRLHIAGSGTGNLSIVGGGTVSSNTAEIALFGQGVGTIDVGGGGTGAATWNNTGGMFIGSQGKGTLNVTGGGTVTSGISSLGDSAGGNGTANIGGGTGTATWNAGNVAYVGNSGTGTVNVTGGGNVSSGTTYLGYATGSSGTVTVGGGTGLSSWTGFGPLVVGRQGAGILNINSGGTVTSSTLEGGNANSQVNFNGGTLRLTRVGSNTSSNRINLGAAGGTIETGEGNQLTLQGAITGEGELRKSGAGTLILTTTNQYTGGTVVEEGKLLLNDSYTLNGVLSVEDGGILANAGTSGITGNVTIGSGGLLSPGNNGSVGTLQLANALELQAWSVLNIQINSALSNSLVDVLGTVELEGLLSITLGSGFTALASDSFVILRGESITGQFVNTTGNVIHTSEGRFDVVYGSDTVTLTNFTVPEPGSFVLAAATLGISAFSRRRRRD